MYLPSFICESEVQSSILIGGHWFPLVDTIVYPDWRTLVSSGRYYSNAFSIHHISPVS